MSPDTLDKMEAPESAARAPGPQEDGRGARPRALPPLLQLLRPADWSKNVLVLAALVFGSRLNWGPELASALLAVLAFTCLASGFYAINDALDAKTDRLHPLKRLRPVACGAIAPRTALWIGVSAIAFGLAIGFVVNPKLGIVCCLYVLLQVAYNFRLKRIPLYDVTALAFGFVLRAAAGAAAIRAHLSVWFIVGVYFLCLYLAFIKRLSDLTTARRQGAAQWHSPAGYDDLAELNWNSAVSAALTVATYLGYTLSEHARAVFNERALVFAVLTPLLIIAMQRLYRRAKEGWSDRPLDALVQDRGFRYSVLAYALAVVLTLYPPHLGDWLTQFLLR